MRLASFIRTLVFAALSVPLGHATAAPLPLVWGEPSSGLPEPPAPDADPASLRVVTLAHDVTLDPRTLAVVATSDVTLHAQSSPIAWLSLVVDAGLHVVEASAFERSVTWEERTVDHQRRVSLTLLPPLERNRIVTLRVRYEGRLACLPAPASRQACRTTGELPFFAEGSAFAGVEGVEPGERLLVLRRPSGTGAAAGSGELIHERDDGQQAVSHWLSSERDARGAHVVVVGDLGRIAVPKSLPPASVLYAQGLAPRRAESLAAWTAEILPFIEARAGLPVAQPALSVVELPAHPSLLATSGAGIVLLSNAYAAPRESRLAEALAHEVSHLIWGTRIAPADASRTALLTEGLATLTEVDFAATTLAPELREAYLARRHREHALLLRYHADLGALPSLLVPDTISVPTNEPARTLWTHILSSAALEHLRVGVGEAAFEAALRRWTLSASESSRTTLDFFALLAEQAGLPLAAALEAWQRSTPLVRLGLDFEQADERSIRVRVSRTGEVVVPLELFIEHEDGEIERRRIVIDGDTPLLDLPVSGPVRSVRPNPRHDAIVWSQSATPGDVDFDGEVDGADLLHCAWRSGKSTEPHQTTEGFFGLDLDFDPRCDENSDGRIEDADLARLIAHFARSAKEPLP